MAKKRKRVAVADAGQKKVCRDPYGQVVTDPHPILGNGGDESSPKSETTPAMPEEGMSSASSAAIASTSSSSPVAAVATAPLTAFGAESKSTSAAASDTDLIDDDELELTVETLEKILRYNVNLKGKRYKALRKALYELGMVVGNVDSQITNSKGGNSVRGNSNSSTVNETIPTQPAQLITPQSISDAVENCSWQRAISLLELMEKQHTKPKLGTLQRWVRTVDAAGCNDASVLTVLNRMLRCSCREYLEKQDNAFANVEKKVEEFRGKHYLPDDKIQMRPGSEGVIRDIPAFHGRLATALATSGGDLSSTCASPVRTPSCIESGLLIIEPETHIRSLNPKYARMGASFFQTCWMEEGKNRKPPNKFDLKVVTDEAGPLGRWVFDSLYLPKPVTRVDLPYVPHAFVLLDVLSPEECDRIIAATESTGFHPDEPLEGQPGESKLAHVCVWMMSEHIERTIFNRVKNLLNPSFGATSANANSSLVATTSENADDVSSQPFCLNRRARCYRYIPGRYYRPHIDGAWPPSYFDEEGRYCELGREEKYDADNDGHIKIPKNDAGHPEGATNSKIQQVAKDMAVAEANKGDGRSAQAKKGQMRISSKYTFLLYLNDDFEGGHTTYFMPSGQGTENILNAFPNKPIRGSAAVFAHGECENALLHEGSPVTKNCKYVIRTEVEYWVER